MYLLVCSDHLSLLVPCIRLREPNRSLGALQSPLSPRSPPVVQAASGRSLPPRPAAETPQVRSGASGRPRRGGAAAGAAPGPCHRHRRLLLLLAPLLPAPLLPAAGCVGAGPAAQPRSWRSGRGHVAAVAAAGLGG